MWFDGCIDGSKFSGVRFTLSGTVGASQTVPWSAFKGGLPSATTDGSDVIALQLTFDWTAGATPYGAQLTVDDIEFFNTPDTGSGGTAGEGGTRSENIGGVAATGGGTEP